ncbi:MAG: hypothetical protein DHS20C13_24100 [Thermodesulfobacteriota bacterium]|nr:MAG: hypothetical protein DHS20C13_24100 [Thermodesulfobacteriota bacterium]
MSAIKNNKHLDLIEQVKGSFPKELLALAQWVVCRSDKQPRIPAQGTPSAKVNDPKTWRDFDTAYNLAKQSDDLYLGYVLKEEDPYTCIDLDIKDDTSQEQIAQFERLIEQVDSYTEKSLNGRGYHIWVKGNIGSGRRTKGIEIYSQKRFMVCTGNVVLERSIQDRHTQLKQIIGSFIDTQDSEPLQVSAIDAQVTEITESDQIIISQAKNASNGDKFDALFNGEWQDLGYPSQSEADFALLSCLAFHTLDDQQIKRIFCSSALGNRDKAHRDDYLDGSLSRVRQTESNYLNRNKRSTPSNSKKTGFHVIDDETSKKLYPGVWHFDADKDGNTTQTRICSPVYVEAVTYDGQENNFGRMLRFRNTRGSWRSWAMPMELLRGSGEELRGELLSMGVEIDTTQKSRNLLSTYLQAEPPEKHVRCALQVGWCDNSFVLPDEVIGENASGIIFQSGERGHDEFTKAGTLEGWRDEISALAIGNPVLILAISAAFAGVLLSRCNAESGGIHLVGDSSTGKTTALEVACSVWGGVNYRRSWRATANGMEGAAVLFNDCLLALDEISECDPREVGKIVYALGNGRGKQRATRTGGARSVNRWKSFVVSTGERTIGTTMAEGGYRAKAGQSVRLLDIPAQREFGIYDNLHQFSTGAALSDKIKQVVAMHYGHAGRTFLEKLTREDRNLTAMLEAIKENPRFRVDASQGQDKRAVGRFALLALAGEIATEYGITGWSAGEAIEAAVEGFDAWYKLRGDGNDEKRRILEQVSNFIDRHGDGRFCNIEGTAGTQIRDRAGWWKDTDDSREYLFTSEGLHEALKGFDFKRALDVLQDAGALKSCKDKRRAGSYRVAGRTIKLYAINADVLNGEVKQPMIVF